MLVVVMMLSLAACSKAPAEEDAALDEVVDIPAGSEQEPSDQPETNDPKPSVPENKPAENEKEEEPEKKPEENKPADKEPENKVPEDTTIPEDQEPEDTTDEEIVFEDEEEEPSYEGWIKVASYNTKALLYSKDKEGIVGELKDIDADIVGIQEIDSFTTRSGQYDQMEYLAKECGYPYWSFDKLIDHSGGAYGMGILSRYPIKESSVVQYTAQEAKDHVRKYGRHVLDVNGKDVVFFNSHMCIRDEGKAIGKQQLYQVLADMDDEKYGILTADFNLKAPLCAEQVAKFNKLKILNTGEKNMTSYIGQKLASAYIDNIVTTKSFDTYFDAWSGTGIMVSETKYSDHNMVYTYVNFK